MEKVIPLGDVGSVTVSESAGVASVSLSILASLGGGEASGVLSAKASVEVDLGAKQAADLGFAVLEAKFPSIAGLLEAAKMEVDALLAKS